MALWQAREVPEVCVCFSWCAFLGPWYFKIDIYWSRQLACSCFLLVIVCWGWWHLQSCQHCVVVLFTIRCLPDSCASAMSQRACGVLSPLYAIILEHIWFFPSITSLLGCASYVVMALFCSDPCNHAIGLNPTTVWQQGVLSIPVSLCSALMLRICSGHAGMYLVTSWFSVIAVLFNVMDDIVFHCIRDYTCRDSCE